MKGKEENEMKIPGMGKGGKVPGVQKVNMGGKAKRMFGPDKAFKTMYKKPAHKKRGMF